MRKLLPRLRPLFSSLLFFFNLVALALFLVLASKAYAQDTTAAAPPVETHSLWQNPIIQLLLPTLALATMGAIIALLVKLVTWLHSKEQSNKVFHYLALGGELMLNIARELEVTLRPKLANAEGGLGPDKIAEMRKAAIDKFEAAAPAALKAGLTKALGEAGMGQWVSGQIEAAHTKIDLAQASIDSASALPNPQPA